MARGIFRKAAIERMARPGRADQPLRLVGASGWLVLASVVMLIVSGLIWAAQTMAPMKARAPGILIDEAGLVELVSEQGGALLSLEISPGDLVDEGQVIATLSRSDLRRELNGARALLEDQKERLSQLSQAQEARLEREAAADTRRLGALAATMDTLNGRLPVFLERAKELEALAGRGVVPLDRLLDAQIAVSDLEERMANLAQEIRGIELQASERAATAQFDLLEERLAIEEQARVIARLEARLAEERVVRATHSGRVVELQVNQGDVLPAGGALATLVLAGEERQIVAVMFVPPEDGKRIAPGMAAEIAPTTVEREVFGHITAEVLSVSELPATPDGMRRILQNDQLVQQLSLQGAPIEVRVKMRADATTETGYAWSASDGPISGVNAGTLVEGRIILEERPIIDLIMPGTSQRIAAFMAGADP